MKPAKPRASDVFPAPLGPIMPTISPGATIRLALSTTRRLPRRSESSLTSSIGYRISQVNFGELATCKHLCRDTAFPYPALRHDAGVIRDAGHEIQVVL